MAWNYSGDPASDRKDEVRFLVGDTDSSDPLVLDEEIEAVLVHYPPAEGKPAWLAGAHVADGLASKFARKMQRSIGSLSASAQQQYEHYREVAATLRMLYATNGKGSTASGAGVTPAIPILSGGGKTYLGDTHYMNKNDR
jgi:hypothetical protein